MTTQEQAIELVKAERQRQDNKWGYPQKNTPFEWVSILTEEVGELAQATNDAYLGQGCTRDVNKIIQEATQAAAVAVSIIEHLSEPEQKIRACRVCGCTDDHACEGGCWWIEKDLCSKCARKIAKEANK